MLEAERFRRMYILSKYPLAAKSVDDEVSWEWFRQHDVQSEISLTDSQRALDTARELLKRYE